MKIIVSQQNKLIKITFKQGGAVDNYEVDKTDDFLAAIDKFIKKRKIDLAVLEKASLKFIGTGILTERIIRAIMKGLNL